MALRAGRSVARCEEVHSSLLGELAMVLSRPRELDAFVLVGRRRDGSVLRADEVAALRGTLHAVGVEWQALRWDALQRERAHEVGLRPERSGYGRTQGKFYFGLALPTHFRPGVAPRNCAVST